MRKRLAMLCYRVARWLAPRLFIGSGMTVADMQIQLRWLRTELCALPRKQLDGMEGRHFADQIHILEAALKHAERMGYKEPMYEQVKIEIKHLGEGTEYDYKEAVATGRKVSEVVRDRVKREIFMAVAKGLADSAEIEKFMYFREYGDIRTVGIRLYLKHDDQ